MLIHVENRMQYLFVDKMENIDLKAAELCV